MSRRLFLGALGGALVGLTSGLAAGQPHIALPPINLGQTSFLDGQGGPGLMTRVPVDLYDAPRFDGAGGQTLPGDNALLTLTELTHLAYSPLRVFGGYLGIEILVPVVFVHLGTPTGKASTAGLGDAIVSPLVFQAPDTKLFGRPFFHRLDVDVNVPAGSTAATQPSTWATPFSPGKPFISTAPSRSR